MPPETLICHRTQLESGCGAWAATGGNGQIHLAFSFFESVFQEPPCAPSPMLGGPGWAGGGKGPGSPALRAPRTPLTVLLIVNHGQMCSVPQQTGQTWATWEGFQVVREGSCNWEDFTWK